jgi:hypothetical protein
MANRRYRGRRFDRRVDQEDFGERFGNNYGFAREGERVEPIGPETERSEYVNRYSRPDNSSVPQESGPYRGLGPKGYVRSDERIKDEICEILTRHGQLDARRVELDVQNGEVLLSGIVRHRRDKRLAEDIAFNVSGVRDVRNDLAVE